MGDPQLEAEKKRNIKEDLLFGSKSSAKWPTLNVIRHNSQVECENLAFKEKLQLYK